MKTLHIILDNGHGNDTQGKCSPKLDETEFDLSHEFITNGRYREYLSNRKIVKLLKEKLEQLGHDVHIVVPEDRDISLGERVRRINKICDKYGSVNCIMISVHSNAAGNSVWTNATGLSVHIATNASMKSKALAEHIYNAGDTLGYHGNRCTPKERYWVNNFYIIKNTKCPCVLTENLFYTSKKDLHTLMSDEGINGIVKYHVGGIMNYANENFWTK